MPVLYGWVYILTILTVLVTVYLSPGKAHADGGEDLSGGGPCGIRERSGRRKKSGRDLQR